MTDQRTPISTGNVDATGQPLGAEQVLAPQQAPMDDDVGGPDADAGDEPGIEQTSTDDLFVPGGA